MPGAPPAGRAGRGRRGAVPDRRGHRVLGVRPAAAQPAAGRDGGGRHRRGRLGGAVPDGDHQPHPDAVDHGLRLAVRADPDRRGVLPRCGHPHRRRPAAPLRRRPGRAGRLRGAAVPPAVRQRPARPLRAGARRRRPRHAVLQPDPAGVPADRPQRVPDPAGPAVRQLQRRRPTAADLRRGRRGRRPGRCGAAAPPAGRRRAGPGHGGRAGRRAPPGGGPDPAGRRRAGRRPDRPGRADHLPRPAGGQPRPPAAGDPPARLGAARRRAARRPRPGRRPAGAGGGPRVHQQPVGRHQLRGRDRVHRPADPGAPPARGHSS